MYITEKIEQFLNEAQQKKLKSPESTEIVFEKISKDLMECKYISNPGVLKVDWAKHWAAQIDFERDQKTREWKSTNIKIQVVPKDGDPITMDVGGLTRLRHKLPREKFEGQFSKKLFGKIIQWLEEEVKKWLMDFIGDGTQQQFWDTLENMGADVEKR